MEIKTAYNLGDQVLVQPEEDGDQVPDEHCPTGIVEAFHYDATHLLTLVRLQGLTMWLKENRLRPVKQAKTKKASDK